ncbi:MAG: 4'-phosphopantetheinyl transferase family protein [Flavobacterium sp.]
MPLYKEIVCNENAKLYLWKITEEIEFFKHAVLLKDVSQKRVDAMKSESHQKGFLAVRMLLQHVGYTDFDLYYDAFGKPHLSDGKCISISHSHTFSAIAISDQPIGLDVEQVKEKVLKIASRFMDVSHLENLSDAEKMKKATVIWGIKESIFKIKNETGISFPKHIFEEEFNLESKKTIAQLQFNAKTENFNVVFDSVEEYIYVCAFEVDPNFLQ